MSWEELYYIRRNLYGLRSIAGFGYSLQGPGAFCIRSKYVSYANVYKLQVAFVEINQIFAIILMAIYGFVAMNISVENRCFHANKTDAI